MAKPILVANWKNYPKSLFEARRLIRELAKDARLYKKVHFFIAPPLTYFDLVANSKSTFLHLASQDMPPVAKGTVTGTITPDILQSFGVELSIIGHSERRKLGEPNEIVNQKIKIAIASGIIPVVCVGENSRDNDGEYFEFLRHQIKATFSGLGKITASQLMVAYEPVWAIGKSAKDAIKPEDLAQAAIFIRKVLTDLFGRPRADRIPILYGGSAEPTNVQELFRGTDIKGFLVGHESLNPKDFKEIVKAII